VETKPAAQVDVPEAAEQRSDAPSSEGTDAPSSLDLQLQRARPVANRMQQARSARLFGRRVFCMDRKLEIVRRVGGGAMGTVYEARYAGARIALKALNQLSPQQIYGLKKEFRMLANIAHPNVVTAYHLFAAEDTWYFTMELVDGLTLAEAWRATRARHPPHEHEALLRALLRQLVEGVAATHRAGLVHRDLKPANVLVSSAGRLVIVDFGLVSEDESGGMGQTVEHSLAGTPAYMAPELACGSRATPASDWYAVGLMLFELLTSRSPEARSLTAQPHEPLHAWLPSEHAPHVPADLDALCRALTDLDPLRRPSSEQMTAQVRGWNLLQPSARYDWVAQPRSAAFVGRERELSILREAHEEARRGRPVWVLVEGDSGTGKSALLSELAARLRALPRAVVLEGRCIEQELLPRRGIDALVDQLTRFLLRLAPEEALQLVPRDITALCALFPVLSRVPCMRLAAASVSCPDEPALARSCALAGLGELLCRIADRRPLALLIDDLQWADEESLEILCDLVSAPRAPALLIAAAYRDTAGSTLERLAERLPSSVLRSLVLPKFDESESMQLAAQVLAGPELEQATPALTEAIAREAEGMPLYVAELAASARASELEGLACEPNLAELMQARIAELPARARSAFDMLVVAGRPLPTAVLARAAGLCDVHLPLATLRKARLTRLIDDGRGQATDVYHDRVRDACLSLFDQAKLCECRSRLALALTDETDTEPTWLAELFASIGERAKAASTVLALAQRAEQQAQFGQAADLLAQAAAWLEPTAHTSRLAELHEQHAKLLASAGHADQSWRALTRAIRLYAQSDQLGRACRASMSSLSAGNGADALHVLERALERLSLAWPLGPRRLGLRLRLR
jgi:eukaryotic-like serine/threonine-protein kinase